MHVRIQTLSGQESPMHWGPPVDDETMLYRYMDFPKFIHLLTSKMLYFARPSQFNDPSEGLTPQIITLAAQMNVATPPFLRDDWLEPGSESKDVYHFAERFERERNFYGISCWHMADFDSEMMWKLYSGNSPSLAVVTSKHKVIKAIGNNWLYHTGAVAYDLDGPLASTLSLPVILFNKRPNFYYEKEWRIIIDVRKKGSQLVPVDLDLLVEHVLIGPGTEQYHVESITKLLQLTGLGSKAVVRSTLLDKPMDQIKAMIDAKT